MKNSIFSLLFKKEFMSKILKMKEPKEIKEAFGKEGVEMSEKDVISLVESLKSISDKLDECPPEKVKELSDSAKKLDPSVFDSIVGGVDPKITPEQVEFARLQQGTTLLKVGGDIVIKVLDIIDNRKANNQPTFPPEFVPESQNVPPDHKVGGSGGNGGNMVAGTVVLGTGLLAIAALYKKEIKAWLKKKK